MKNHTFRIGWPTFKQTIITDERGYTTAGLGGGEKGAYQSYEVAVKGLPAEDKLRIKISLMGSPAGHG